MNRMWWKLTTLLIIGAFSLAYAQADKPAKPAAEGGLKLQIVGGDDAAKPEKPARPAKPAKPEPAEVAKPAPAAPVLEDVTLEGKIVSEDFERTNKETGDVTTAKRLVLLMADDKRAMLPAANLLKRESPDFKGDLQAMVGQQVRLVGKGTRAKNGNVNVRQISSVTVLEAAPAAEPEDAEE